MNNGSVGNGCRAFLGMRIVLIVLVSSVIQAQTIRVNWRQINLPGQRAIDLDYYNWHTIRMQLAVLTEDEAEQCNRIYIGNSPETLHTYPQCQWNWCEWGCRLTRIAVFTHKNIGTGISMAAVTDDHRLYINDLFGWAEWPLPDPWLRDISFGFFTLFMNGFYWDELYNLDIVDFVFHSEGPLPGDTDRLTVQGIYTPWVLSKYGDIYESTGWRTGGRAWTQRRGIKAQDIGADHYYGRSIWAIARDSSIYGGGIYRYNRTTGVWELANGLARAVTADLHGNPIVVNAWGHLFWGTVIGQ